MELSGALQGYAFADRPRLRPTDRAGNARNFEKSLAQHKNTAPAKNPAGSPKKSGSRRRDLILDCAKVNDHAQSIFLSIWTQKEGENVTRQFKTVEFEDRKTIAAMYAAGAVAEEIAQKIGVSRSTVYTELKRGQDGVTLDKNFRPAYDPALAQKRFQEALRRRGRKKGP